MAYFGITVFALIAFAPTAATSSCGMCLATIGSRRQTRQHAVLTAQALGPHWPRLPPLTASATTPIGRAPMRSASFLPVAAGHVLPGHEERTCALTEKSEADTECLAAINRGADYTNSARNSLSVPAGCPDGCVEGGSSRGCTDIADAFASRSHSLCSSRHRIRRKPPSDKPT